VFVKKETLCHACRRRESSRDLQSGSLLLVYLAPVTLGSTYVNPNLSLPGARRWGGIFPIDQNTGRGQYTTTALASSRNRSWFGGKLQPSRTVSSRLSPTSWADFSLCGKQTSPTPNCFTNHDYDRRRWKSSATFFTATLEMEPGSAIFRPSRSRFRRPRDCFSSMAKRVKVTKRAHPQNAPPRM
jgi:hypothetical protein